MGKKKQHNINARNNIQDILSEVNLLKKNKILSSLLESVPAAIYASKTEGDFGAIFITGNVTSLTGYKPEDFTSHPSFWIDNVHPGDKSMVLETLAKIFDKGHIAYEYRWKVADGAYKWFYTQAQLVKLPTGEISHILGTFIDITERKMFEDEFRKSSFYIDCAKDSIIVLNAEKEIIKVNKEFSKLWGYSSGEVLGKPVSAVFPEKEMPKLFSKMETAISKKIPLDFETLALTKSVGEIPLSIRGSAIFDKDGKLEGFFGIFRDITERNQIEDTLRYSAKRLGILHKIYNDILTIRPLEEIIQVVLKHIRETVPCTRASIAVFDSKKDQAILIAVDIETKTRMGKDVCFPLEEFGIQEGLYFGENIVVDDIRTLSTPSVVDKLLMAEGIHSYINIPLMDLDELIGVINIGSDKPYPFTLQDLEISREIADLLALVMRSKRQDRELRINSERLDLAIAGGNVGIWDWNILTNEVYHSPNFKNLLNYKDHEVEINYDFWYGNLHPDEIDGVMNALNDHLERRIPFDIECRLKTKSGEYCWFRSLGQAIWDDENKPLRMLGTLIDITELKKAEEWLRKSHDTLEVRVKERTAELEKVNEKLLSEINERKRMESKLREADKKLRFHAVELEETNTALKVLLKQLEGDKSNFEEYVTTNIRRLIMPYVAKLKKRKPISKELAFLNVIETNLNEIISPFAHKLSSKYLGFTPKEIQIANLIKDGRQDKDISETLDSSLETIKTHRQNMRKKLGIQGKKINMRSYLISLSR